MLEGIRKEIEKLISLYEAEKAERIKLQSLLEQCKAENEACRKQIGDLEQQVNNLQLSEAFGAGGDKAAAKVISSRRFISGDGASHEACR